jgi:hypothetical protein
MGYYFRLIKYINTTEATNIIPSQKIKSIVNAEMSTFQTLTAPTIVLKVFVAQTRGNPYSKWTLSGQSSLLPQVKANTVAIVQMIMKTVVKTSLLFINTRSTWVFFKLKFKCFPLPKMHLSLYLCIIFSHK